MPATATQPKIAHQAAWVVGCRIVGVASTFASNLLVARLLGPEGFGAFLLATTVLSFGSILALSGLSEAGLRFISENLGLHREGTANSYFRTTLKWATLSSVIATLVVVAALFVFDYWSDDPRISTKTTALIGLGVIVLAWQQLIAQMLRSHNDLRSASFYSGGQTGGPLSNLVFLIPLVLAFSRFVPVTDEQVIGLLVGSVCVTLPLAVWELTRSVRFFYSNGSHDDSLFLSKDARRELANVATSFLGIQMLAFVSVQSDFWIGGMLLDSKDFGLYGAAKRTQLIVHMPIQMALMTVQAAIPRIYAQGRMDELERCFRNAMKWAAIPGIAAILIFTFFPSQVISVIFDESFEGAARIILPLTVGLAALVFFGTPGDVLALTGDHRLVLRVNAFTAIALVVCGIIGARMAGAYGLAVGSSIATIAQNVAFWWIARKRLKMWTHLSFTR